MNSAPTKAASPTPEHQVSDDRAVDNKAFRLPDLSQFARFTKERVIAEVDETRVAVTREEYKPLSDVIQMADGNVGMNLSQSENVPQKAWLVKKLFVYSVGNQEFCFVVTGTWVTLDDSGNVEARAAMQATMAYFDDDGDGSIESFKYIWGESPPIPLWVRNRIHSVNRKTETNR